MRQDSPEEILQYQTWVGKTVCKISGKPFKSRLKVNTVATVVEHEFQRPDGPFMAWAVSFVEDDSFVEAWRCQLININQQ